MEIRKIRLQIDFTDGNSYNYDREYKRDKDGQRTVRESSYNNIEAEIADDMIWGALDMVEIACKEKLEFVKGD